MVYVKSDIYLKKKNVLITLKDRYIFFEHRLTKFLYLFKIKKLRNRTYIVLKCL